MITLPCYKHTSSGNTSGDNSKYVLDDIFTIHFVNRLNGEIAERQFCDEHLLSLPTLGMAAEAKVMSTTCVQLNIIQHHYSNN